MERTVPPGVGAFETPGVRSGRFAASREQALALGRRFWVPAVLAVILIVATVLRVYDIVDNPYGFFADEASFGYNAYTILHSGEDEYGERMPVLFRAFDEYKLPVYIYSQVPFIAILGLSELPVRLTTAFYGVLTVVAVFLLVRELFKNNAMALTAAAVLAIMPWHIHYSRTGLGDITAHVFFLVLALYLFLVGTRKPIYWIAAALAFVLAVYSYRSAWVLSPLLLVALGALYFRQGLRNWPYTIASAVVIVVLLLPIAMHLTSSSSDRTDEQAITTLHLSKRDTVEKAIHQYRQHYYPSFLFKGTAEDNLRHVIPGYGWIYPWQVPFLVLGFAWLVWRPSKTKLLTIAMLAVFPVAAALTIESPRSSRALWGAIAFSIITACGIVMAGQVILEEHEWLRSPSLQRFRRILLPGAALLALAILALTIYFVFPYADTLGIDNETLLRVLIGTVGVALAAGVPFGALRMLSQRSFARSIALVGSSLAAAAAVGIGAVVAVREFGDFRSAYYDEYAKNSGGYWGWQWGPKEIIDHFISVQDQYDLMVMDGGFNAPGIFYSFYAPGECQTCTIGIWDKYVPSDRQLFALRPEGLIFSYEWDVKDALFYPSGELAFVYAEIVGSRTSVPGNLPNVNIREGTRTIEELNDEIARLGNSEAAAQAYAERGEAFLESGDIRLALSDLTSALQLDPDNAVVYMNRANASWAMGDFLGAQQDYERAIGVDPQLAAIYYNRGNMFATVGYIDRALADYGRARDLGETAVLMNNLGNTRLLSREYQVAIDELDQAIALDPSLAIAYANRGNVLFANGLNADQQTHQSALADLDRAIELDPDLAFAYGVRGQLYLELGQLDTALADLDSALALDPSSVPAYTARADVYTRRGDDDRAIADLTRAIDLDRDYALAYAMRAVANLHLGAHDLAAGDLEKAMLLDRAYTHGPLYARNPYWNLGGAREAILREALEAAGEVGDPALRQRLDAVTEYLAATIDGAP